ncbi:MAG: CoA transferase [Cohaesibacteraceae bacterium]|nr:CoA transferase [Cohaesibacteraceae bacterium]
MIELLKGIRIVDLSTIVLGPMASQTLGDLGAEIIKVEPLTGDLARSSGSQSPTGTGALFDNNNRNKKSIALDLKSPEGTEILIKLIGTADVFLHNIRPGAIERLGFGPDAVAGMNPNIIYTAAVGYGHAGPYAEKPAYDDVIQAASGIAALPTYMGQNPSYVPSIIADKIGALHVIYAITSALFQRERTGKGITIEVPMFETLVAFVMNEHLDAASYTQDGEPGYSRLLNPNRRPYQTKDGWLAVMPYSAGHWSGILAVLERQDILDEPWFQSGAERNRRSGELYGILADGLSHRSNAEWSLILDRLDIPYSNVNTLDDLLNDPHLKATGFFDTTNDQSGQMRSIPNPISFCGPKKCRDAPPPGLGAHSKEILADLGYSFEKIRALRKQSILIG